jgi:hypothetical protein
MPGKRKRETAVLSRDSEAESHGDSKPPSGASHDLFRQFFESRFQPLDPPSINDDDGAEEESVEEDSENESELEWEGISDNDDEVEKVEVVEYTDACDASDSLDKHIRKAFMVSCFIYMDCCIHIKAYGIIVCKASIAVRTINYDG